MNQSLYTTLLAMAAADAYALPYENLSPRRVRRWFRATRYYTLLSIIHGGMVSDDTEHAVMTLQAYIASAGDVPTFRRALRWRLMLWMLTLPVGAGAATLKSCLKMWLGFRQTGIWSAGNGAVMRVPILAILCNDVNQLAELIHVSTTLTHSDPKAEHAAYALALLTFAEYHYPDWQTNQILDFVCQNIQDNELIHQIQTYQPDPKRGITGYAYHTVPAVFQAWQQFRDEPLAGIDFLCQCGGDTDTVCALFAAVVGAQYGEVIFSEIKGLWCEPVLRPDFFHALAKQAAKVQQSGQAQTPLAFGGVRTCVRNVVFLMVVLVHGFRRLFPPYG